MQTDRARHSRERLERAHLCASVRYQGSQASGEMTLKILAVAKPLDARAFPGLVRKHLGIAV